MRKFILFFVLLLLLLSFGAFFLSSWNKIKEYNNSRNNEPLTGSLEEVSQRQLPSTYSDYSSESLNQALSDKRVVFMFFTSNWCNECKGQDEINNEILTGLTNGGIFGARIHILDSETTTETSALAKKYGVDRENTMVILDTNGAIQFKNTGEIEPEILLQKLMEVVNK